MTKVKKEVKEEVVDVVAQAQVVEPVVKGYHVFGVKGNLVAYVKGEEEAKVEATKVGGFYKEIK